MNNNMTTLFSAFALVLYAGLLTGSSALAQVQAADYVLTNGKIYTVNEQQPWAEAVAVKGRDIVYVGDNAGAQAFIGDDTIVADLGGKLMLPGFIDTHNHATLVAGVAIALHLDTPVNGRGDKKKMLDGVAAWVAANPDGPYFSMGGSFEGLVDIDRKDIDKIIADQPFVMIAQTGHGGWANTKALEMSGVVKGKPDPIDSFAREKDGTPTGFVRSSAAVFYLVERLKLIPPEAISANAELLIQAMAADGITSTLQAGHLHGLEQTMMQTMAELERSGRLPVRISYVAHFAQRPRHIDPALANIRKFVGKYDSELFWVDSLKIHGDGDFGGYTVGLLEPYADNPDMGLGMVSFPDTDQLVQFLRDSADLGVKHIHMHAIGDRTVRQALDAFEQLRQAGYKDLRLSTGHTNMVHPDDLPRFSQLNVMADLHAQYAGPGYNARIGEKRQRERMFPVQSMARDGVRLTIGSDFPAGDQNPFRSIAVIISRRYPGDDDEVLPPASEALTIEQAIQAYTLNGAYLLGKEDLLGSIEVGKRADLIVVDRNILELSPEEIQHARVVSTMMNGKVVFNDAVGWEDPAAELVEDFEGFNFCESHDELSEVQAHK